MQVIEELLKDGIRQIGSYGPIYKVEGVEKELPNGDFLMSILLLESQQKDSYLLSNILKDPILNK